MNRKLAFYSTKFNLITVYKLNQMIKIVNKAFKSSITNLSLTIVSSSFGTQLQTTTYPYVFGGLKNVPFTQSMPSYVLIN
jgi:hypothetical protein